jgi:hypothetical protein
MINAANSFGNTTINGTLTVTGNTGLQANVSITSALSVGGVFAVTGAATLGSTLAVTGKSDLPTVSTASMNAAVAVVTTGTVTNLTSTSASIASMNAGVALLTTATVTTLTATGASIASANLGNAVISSMTLTGASVASANVGTATITGNLTLSGGTANGVLYLDGSKVATSGTALIFDGSKLGIGGTPPTTLYVKGTAGGTDPTVVTGERVRIQSNDTTGRSTYLSTIAGTAANSGILFGDQDAADVGRILYAHGTNSLQFFTNSAEVGRFDSSGNFGVGTSSPANKLTVSFSDATGSTLGFSLSNTSTSTNQSYVGMALSSQNGTVLGDVFCVPTAGTVLSGGGLVVRTQSTYPIAFQTNNTERMRITSAGELLVGGTTAINSSSGFIACEKLNGQSGIALFRNDTSIVAGNPFGSIDFYGNDTTANAVTLHAYFAAVASGTHSAGSNPTDLTFGTTATGSATVTERMRLDASGNLGLGVTPSIYTTGKAIDVGTGSAFWGVSNTQTQILNNAYLNTDFKYKNGGAASRLRMVDSAFEFYTAPSGTAGNTITFTQAMTLDASGNLGVGTTSPSRRLHVYSTGNIPVRIETNTSDTKIEILTSSGTQYVQGSVNDLLFGTNNTERGRFTAGGYFKASDNGAYVGVTGTYHEFRSTAATYISYLTNTNAAPLGQVIEYTTATPNGTGNVFLYCSDATAVRATIRSNGGLANYQANNVDLSDARTKKEINPASSMWDKIGALEIVTYKYNDQTHDDVNVGVIAQQVESVEPVWVDSDGFGETPEDEEPLKTVYTKDITFAAIKALQEAMARIEQLEAKVAALESK